jgi:hypothetical protein
MLSFRSDDEVGEPKARSARSEPWRAEQSSRDRALAVLRRSEGTCFSFRSDDEVR